MSQPFDLSLFPDLPPEVVKAFEAAQFELAVERAARQHEQAVVAEKDTFITELKALIDKLQGQVGQYRHAKFGPKSEKLDPAQLELALEDLEAAIAETQQQIDAVEAKIAARKNRKMNCEPADCPRTACASSMKSTNGSRSMLRPRKSAAMVSISAILSRSNVRVFGS